MDEELVLVHVGRLASFGTVIGFIGVPAPVGTAFFATQAVERMRAVHWRILLPRRCFIFCLHPGFNAYRSIGVAKCDGASLGGGCGLGQVASGIVCVSPNL